MREKWSGTAIVALLALGLLCVGPALAGKPDKPGKPGGGGDSDLVGIIYYWQAPCAGGGPFGYFTMNPDGSEKTLLPPNVGGEPSVDLHGGFRWFLKAPTIPGEVYPDCSPRRKIIAVRDDGAVTIDLMNDPTFKIKGASDSLPPYARPLVWAPDPPAIDGRVSWAGVRWAGGETEDCDGEEPPPPEPYDAGIYAAALNFNPDGTPALGTPELVMDADWILDSETQTYSTGVQRLDWAPDGSRIVYGQGGGLYLWDFAEETLLTSSGGGPLWSPEGSWILFGTGAGTLRIRPDGSDEELIIPHPNCRQGTCYVRQPRWSPTGSHLIYQEWRRSPKTGFEVTMDIYRAKADGRSRKILSDEGECATPVAWRFKPGACCISGVCHDGITETGCTAQGGTYAGEGTRCSDSPPPCD